MHFLQRSLTTTIIMIINNSLKENAFLQRPRHIADEYHFVVNICNCIIDFLNITDLQVHVQIKKWGGKIDWASKHIHFANKYIHGVINVTIIFF